MCFQREEERNRDVEKEWHCDKDKGGRRILRERERERERERGREREREREKE